MRRVNKHLSFSATDLVNFLGCRHATYLDVLDLENPASPAPADPFLELLQSKGLAHERRHLQSLRDAGRSIVDLTADGQKFDRVVRTRESMASGVDVIYQGALQGDRWHGYADFLIRVAGQSALGDFHYEPVDTKLAGAAQPKHALQLAVYARLLAHAQDRLPERMHIVVADGSVTSLRTADVHWYSEVAREGLEAYGDHLPTASMGEPCGHCSQCRWNARCEAEWQRVDHLSQVAGITRGQRAKLEAAGISTMAALAAAGPAVPGAGPAGLRVPGMQAETFAKLKSQAGLQVAKRTDGVNRVEVLPAVPGKGLARLPQPDLGDLFFDMEGDPLYEGGLEYLFGMVEVADGAARFTAFWGHDRAEEKIAFEQVMDFIMARLARFPEAHIYHYAPYEKTAISRLGQLHGTRENEVDVLLRTGKLVDLYQVVRESIRVSEPRYSIKNLETFYMKGGRSGDVKDAGASVVVYERWRELGDPQMLREIEQYNRIDCESTWKLREWLLTLRAPGTPWRGDGPPEPADPDKAAKQLAAEQRCVDMQARLLRAPEHEKRVRLLIGQLLEFYRREAKPAYWAMFARRDLSEEELIEDAECIGGLRADPTTPPYAEKRSLVHTFRFPPQDYKLRLGDRPQIAATGRDAGEIVFLDEDSGQIALKIGAKAEPYEPTFSLAPGGPIGTGEQLEALYRFAEAVADGADGYAAVRSILAREAPRLIGRRAGHAIIADGGDVLQGSSVAIGMLDESYMLVQGPPGTGKTYLSAHVIVDLLAQGNRIAVASNSHKAINNLLMEVERQAVERGLVFRGAKKCSSDDHRLNGGMIVDKQGNQEISSGHYDLVGGTAWLFSRLEFDQSFDYLFIDEAGQVAIANVVAMGLCARNIVLVGDQMQLAQPAQGVHPGDSGKSVLDYLLGETVTVPPDRGIFLPVTRRMHRDICRFISDAVYEGRLEAEPRQSVQRLVLAVGADPALKASGISWVPVEHEGCGQKSEPESARISALYASLLRQRWVDRNGREAAISLGEILVVTPYNMQVNHLQSVLPAGARVGTVDKFQGQEAAVLLVSMATSTAEDISRGLDFLYSRNRLNVAISRAKCLAVVVANPQLLAAPCTTIEQLRLVNTLCFLREYAKA
jgi:uncharacterized protein